MSRLCHAWIMARAVAAVAVLAVVFLWLLAAEYALAHPLAAVALLALVAMGT